MQVALLPILQGAVHQKCIVAYGHANCFYPPPFRKANTDAPQECNLFRRRHMPFRRQGNRLAGVSRSTYFAQLVLEKGHNPHMIFDMPMLT